MTCSPPHENASTLHRKVLPVNQYVFAHAAQTPNGQCIAA
jgi:hypothetical protein